MEQLVASLDEYRQAAADEEKCLDYHLDTVRKRLQDLEREDLEREDGPEGLNQQAVDETLRAGLGKTSEQAERVQLQTAHAGLDQAEEACPHRGGWTLLPTLSPGERERARGRFVLLCPSASKSERELCAPVARPKAGKMDHPTEGPGLAQRSFRWS